MTQKTLRTTMRSVVATVAAAAVATGVSMPGAVSADDKIMLGYGAAVTGGLAPYDSPDGVRCQVDRINEGGGILGRQVELVIRDMRSDSALSGTVAQELLDLGAVALLGPPTDDTIIPMAMLAAPRGVATLSVGGTQPAFPVAATTNGYLVGHGDNASAAAAAEYAYKNGARTALLTVSHDVGSYSLVTPEYFAAAFERLGGKILGRVNYNAGLSDYTPQITEIQAMDVKPDVIFAAMIVPEAGVFPRQLAAAGLDIPVYGTDGHDDPGVLEIGGEGARLVKFVTHGFQSEGSPLEEFYADCEKRGYKVQNIFFGLGGDAVLLVKAAIEAAGSADDAAAVNTAMRELEGVAGVTTDTITYRGTNGAPLRRMTLMQVKDGKFVDEAKILPEFVPAP